MLYLDLDEVDAVMSLTPSWSTRAFAPARFVRSDFLGPTDKPLKTAVLDRVEQALGFRPNGSVRLLANLRYFGVIMNPLTTYYCFNSGDDNSGGEPSGAEKGEKLVAMVAEVTNTPWRERHAYVLPAPADGDVHQCFNKVFHVSPFNPMHQYYQWFNSAPTPDDKPLTVHLENWEAAGEAPNSAQDLKIMDASLHLKLEPISARRLNRLLIDYPWMTVKVLSAIYWQALLLAIKRLPFYPHPSPDS